MSQRIGALIASALVALNITVESISMPFRDVMNYLSDPFNVLYTYEDYKVEDYFNQSTVVIHPNKTTIDGVDYDEVWFSHDAAEKFRVNSFDFISANSLASESSGTFASGVGSIMGVPLFEINGRNRSQAFVIPNVPGRYSVGDGYCIVSPYYSSFRYEIFNPSDSRMINTTKPGPLNFFIGDPSGDLYRFISNDPSPNWPSQYTSLGALSGVQFINNPFDYDWVSGIIPAEQDFDEDDGLRLLVPHTTPEQETPIQDFVDDHPDYDTPGGKEIDVDVDPDVTLEVDDLIDLIIPLIPIIHSEFAPLEIEPGPVDPSTIGNTQWTLLDIHLDTIESILESGQLALQNTLQNIRQDIQAIPSAIQQIISSILTKLDSIIQAISNLGNTILQEIEEGPIRLSRKAIDAIKSIFLPILVSLKNALGIWHYVVEWFTAISAPFTWFRGVMDSSRPSLLAPIYATIAGFIVIAVYRRFGR